ncbi:hypothetical protein [Proteus mirabilis]|uniref:hypothetical protein n=1 Tax=Proteus mirabilis TaxID=584 RepID=UPI0012EB9153|nr:hypothetical protein [Proteus mirabilis]MVD48988.1 hypothetical protein [Proteus mirabilis]MVD71670.1 hypothetical protein [Proteus mirabilis]MVF40134.1 hypothetical protein [Proteus mirabilis]NHU35141.1 hypothetical protein [Proteus mirabilis]QKQ97856.1 hypothetical protein GCE56_11215 [Proteus mirabilis]
MAKSSAERKALQRKRQKELGVTKIELLVDNQELEMLQRNCVLRMPGREPYDEAEYIQMLIRNDDARLKREIAELSQRCCGKCGEALPVAECCLSGDAECWNTRGWHEIKLKVE